MTIAVPVAQHVMKLAPLWVLMAAVAGVAAGELAPPERAYKILMLLPVSSRSHRNVFMPLAEALADRGHEIVMLTNQPKSSKHPNIHEFSHDLPHFRVGEVNMFDYRSDPTGGLTEFEVVLPLMARDIYKVPVVKDLYERRKEFDLIIVDHAFNEVVYPFLHEAIFIMLTTPGLDYRQSAVLGNVLHPAYVPNHKSDFPQPISLWHRFLNTMIHIAIAVYWRKWTIVPLTQKEISAQFPELPPLLDLERNMSLALMNTHFSIGIPLPLLPSQVEVGGMHCRPARPLPQELESWISGAGAAGVIYFNLGTVARGTHLPVQYRDLLIQVFRRLPQRVLWKYEEELENLPDNMMIRKWLPQQDILAHHNVKVFITHCGLLGLQEAIYHATPLLALPIFVDQHRNGMFVKKSELGHTLVWEELSEDMIYDALTDIIYNPKYKENVMRMSAGMRDQQTSPRELAVFWTEYVIRHRGAPQLRSPAAQLSWVEFLMLDVLLLLLLALFLLVFILRRIFRVIAAKLFSDSKKKKE
ncbi:UDP-glycosyltransferase UGT5 isoform X2 [Procambarus clarkii]|uniref:UDP-glycosyltransferase UGT5 isoform X2 n=1 Tax=Procambarus clarkii TaxID=6728 RepID=UPI0037439EC5